MTPSSRRALRNVLQQADRLGRRLLMKMSKLSDERYRLAIRAHVRSNLPKLDQFVTRRSLVRDRQYAIVFKGKIAVGKRKRVRSFLEPRRAWQANHGAILRLKAFELCSSYKKAAGTLRMVAVRRFFLILSSFPRYPFFTLSEIRRGLSKVRKQLPGWAVQIWL